MSALSIAVIAVAVAGCLLVLWYFLAPRPAVSVSGGSVEIIVDGGYSPGTIRVPAGQPIHLMFDRREASGCSEEVVFPSLGVKRFLPPFARTEIVIPALTSGTYAFTCGMSMLQGTLIVE